MNLKEFLSTHLPAGRSVPLSRTKRCTALSARRDGLALPANRGRTPAKSGLDRLACFDIVRRTRSTPMQHRLELLTFCRSLINDGVLLPAEVQSLKTFLALNKEYCTTFPGQQMAARLERIFADGRVTEAERADLLYLLRRATKTEIQLEPEEAQLTFDEPAGVQFKGMHFCFLGKFVSGSARWLRRTTEDCEAVFQEDLDARTAYVVIGSEGDVMNSVVRQIRERRAILKVLSEKSWLALVTARQNSVL